MPRLFGYTPNPRATEKFVSSLKYPTIREAGPRLRSKDSEDVVLYPAILKVCPSYSRVAQAIGSCVGHGFAGCVDAVSAVEISVHGEDQDWGGRTLEASIYAFSRVEARPGQKVNNGGDGSYGGAAAKAVTQWGTLHYGVDYDGVRFDEYSGQRESEWGRTGVPDSLEPHAKRRVMKTASLVENFTDLSRAITSGYAVAICSGQGFTMTRDKDGFCAARGSWSHCLAAVGKRGGSRPGALIWNSWGPKSNSGPHYSGVPGVTMPPAFVGCTFWADADVVDSMLRGGDSFALSGYDGFPPRRIPSWSEGIL